MRSGKERLIKLFSTQDVNQRDVIKEDLIPSFVNIEDDKVKRITKDGDGPISGYLLIESISNHHLALKVNDDIFYTISATETGLVIGILKKGESKPIVAINDNKGLDLEGDFLNNFKKRMLGNLPPELRKELTRQVIEQFEEKGFPLQIGGILQGKEYVGIPTSGFKGFKEGVAPANGSKQQIWIIPKDSYGAYKIRAWLEKGGQYYVSLESTVCFFPGGIVKPYHCFLQLIWEKITRRFSEPHLFKLRLKAKIVKSALYCNGEFVPNLILIAEKENEQGQGQVFKLKLKSSRSVRGGADIYYSIERLWEGPGWIDTTE